MGRKGITCELNPPQWDYRLSVEKTSLGVVRMKEKSERQSKRGQNVMAKRRKGGG